jgi:hypothetical protein
MVFGVGMWALGIPLSIVIRNRPEQYGYLRDGEVSREPVAELEKKAKGVEIGLREALSRRAFLYLNIAELIRMLTITTVIIHVMPYLSSVGIPRESAGMVAGAIPLFSTIGSASIGGIIGPTFAGWVFDTVGNYHIIWLVLSGLSALTICLIVRIR